MKDMNWNRTKGNGRARVRGNKETMRIWRRDSTYLLHDTRLPLRERDVATRLILDKLDLNLSALATGLIIIVVVVVGAHTRSLGAAVVSGAVTGGLLQVILGGRRVLLTDGSDVGHAGIGLKTAGKRRKKNGVNPRGQ
jgi:hypothetical protein